MHLSFCSPHPPYDPPERFMQEEEDWEPLASDSELSDEESKRLQKMARAYRGMIRMLDEYVGEIFDALTANGQLDNTVIAFVSDHGEMLGDFGRMQKNQSFDGSARIPFAIRHPEHLDGRVDSSLVELTDLTATFLECAGLSANEVLAKQWPVCPWPNYALEVPCRSLMPRIESEENTHRDFAFSENILWQMLVGERYKYVRYRPGQIGEESIEALFDLEADPFEENDLAKVESSKPIIADFRERLLQHLERYHPAQMSWMPYGDIV